MTSGFLVAAEGGEHVVNELPFASMGFGLIALAVFALLWALLWSFRNTLALDPHAGHASEHGHAGAADDPDTGPRHPR